MNDSLARLRALTRRHFFADCRIGLGALGLASLLDERLLASPSGEADRRNNPLAVRPTHFPPKATSVIFLFMAGGPSQLELFNYRPRLQELDGQVIPESFVAGKRFAFLKRDAQLLGTRRKFARHGACGTELSECLPHLATVVDDIAVVRSMKTDVFNHGPAKLFVNTGSPQFSGRPSMGAWVTYGIGSEASDLPGFVVLQSGPRGPRGGAPLWGSGFLPTAYQGVPFLNGAEPILNLSNPRGVDRAGQAEFIDAVTDLNRLRRAAVGDPEIDTRIAAYEMAYRMQSSAPELMDLSGETQQTLEMYGADPTTPSFARNCLLARRLVERGVRFVQVFPSPYGVWDSHQKLKENHERLCGTLDLPIAGLITDLKQRGLLDETVVVFCTEFGRTPGLEQRAGGKDGRDHHPHGFTVWLAGAGLKRGYVHGATDELGYHALGEGHYVTDLHATVLYLLGLDGRRLEVPGRKRLEIDHGKVIDDILA